MQLSRSHWPGLADLGRLFFFCRALLRRKRQGKKTKNEKPSKFLSMLSANFSIRRKAGACVLSLGGGESQCGGVALPKGRFGPEGAGLHTLCRAPFDPIPPGTPACFWLCVKRFWLSFWKHFFSFIMAPCMVSVIDTACGLKAIGKPIFHED
jgi:hypothetical protein